MGYKHKKVSCELEQKILELWKNGISVAKISKQLFGAEQVSGNQTYQAFHSCVYKIC